MYTGVTRMGEETGGVCKFMVCTVHEGERRFRGMAFGLEHGASLDILHILHNTYNH